MVEIDIAPKPDTFINTTFQRRLAQREAQAGILPAELLVTPEDRADQYKRLGKMIGHTPLLNLGEVNGSTILAKVESQNPTESHYDRTYLATLRCLENDGIIKPGDELLETTSGSAGTSFAWLCSRLGYKARIMVPPVLPQGRVQEMVNFGAKIIKPETGYVPEVVGMFKEELKKYKDTRKNHYTDDYKVVTFTKEDGTRVCAVNHSANRLSVDAFHSIGEEVKEVLPEGTNVDYVVSVLGNWTTTTALAETFPDAKLIGLEDENNPVQFEAKFPGKFEEIHGKKPEFKQHRLFGASAEGTPLVFPNVDLLEDVILAKEELTAEIKSVVNSGKPVVDTIGNSSAASLAEARKLAEEHPGSVILMFFYDKGDRYGEPVRTTPSDSYNISETNQVRERARLMNVGWRQSRVKNLKELPGDLVDFRAGGKSRAYEGWALS